MSPKTKPTTAAILCFALSLPAFSGTETDCSDAIRLMAGTSRVPPEILRAVAITESGRSIGQGPAQPWPWALNQGGKSLWFDNKNAALDHLGALIATGVSNVDIGCFQLNWRWHGDAFPSLEAMMDPAENAAYAAGFLEDLYERTGSWEKAVAAYHSTTPDFAERYMERFLPIYAGVLDSGGTAPVPSASEERVNFYPLLQSGASATPGSLVPNAPPRRPLFGGS